MRTGDARAEIELHSDGRFSGAACCQITELPTCKAAPLQALGGFYALRVCKLFHVQFSPSERPPRFAPRICEGLGFLGIELDEAANNRHAPCISTGTGTGTGTRSGSVTVRVIRTDEESVIAASSLRVLGLE